MISLGGKGPKLTYEHCQAEKKDPKSCTRTGKGGFGSCEMESSGNDASNIELPSCFTNSCPGMPVNFGEASINNKGSIDRVCKWLLATEQSCSHNCSPYEQGELEDEVAECRRWEKYPNACCEDPMECTTAKPCADSNEARAGTFILGLILLLLGLILTASFSCGICPICCCAKDKVVVPQPQPQMAVVAQPQMAMAPGMVVQAAPAVAIAAPVGK